MSYAYLLPYEDKQLPLSLKMYGASDYATMEVEFGKKEPDFTEHGIVGMDRIGDLWFTDWFFRQCETDEGIKAFIRLVGLYKPLRWWNEGGLIDKAIGPAIKDAMRRHQRYVSIEQLASIDDKSMKVQAFHARATARTVHFPLRRKWTDHVVDQLCRFPGAKHDDAVDVCGLIGRGVDKMTNASLPYEKPRDTLVPFSVKWLEYKSGSEKPKVRYFA
jgi:predicted phage terminase large subunit-like protein